ncbi:MAG: InlB B-repeat-containing protein [Clostridia bacterium]|jgi:uncharacterized repeat protein (TIGR02543 family)
MRLKTEGLKRVLSVVVSIVMISGFILVQTPSTQASAEVIVIVASSNSSDVYKSQANFVCVDGILPQQLKDQIAGGNKRFRFAPGSYNIEGLNLQIAGNTVFEGISEIKQPVDFKQMLYPNSSTMAVFETGGSTDSTMEADSSKIGFISTRLNATAVNISNIALNGYTVLKLNGLKNSTISNILIHNYSGTYPNGHWCNMGYSGATASFWLYGTSENVTVQNCQIQCSSHHGFAIHTGTSNSWAKNINIKGVRALYCGNGQLKGDTEADKLEAEKRVPESNGRGYYDWSVAFDLCENQSVENVTVEDCYALEGWKCGFYTEPEDSGGHIVNLKVYRCRSDRAGQRNIIPGSNPKSTFSMETENSNFFTQGGYYEDCISVDAEKCGWLCWGLRTTANAVDTSRLKLVRCGDMGSPISLVAESLREPDYETHDIISDGFWSLNATRAALWLYGTDGLKFTNNKILAKSNQSESPVKIGYMERIQFTESRSAANTSAVNIKYKKLRRNIPNSSVTGGVYNLSNSVNTAEIVTGSQFNGCTNVSDTNSKISVIRKTGIINTATYVNDNWGRANYKVTFNSNGGTAVASKNAYAERTITAPTTPKRTGFTFLGWYSKLLGGEKAIFPLQVKSNFTLYAHWKVITPAAPYIKTIKRIASKSINLKWNSVKNARGYEIYRSLTKTGAYKLIAATKLLSYTNSKLTPRKTYYYKMRCYNLNGTAKVFSKMSAVRYARA